MMTYGAYLSKDEHLPKTAGWVALLDTFVAFLAGLLILPAMFVAQELGVAIYNDAGQLLASDTLVFQVLPAMFDSMGAAGIWVSIAFFALMMIAAITSSISMLEPPVNTLVEEAGQSRSQMSWVVGLSVALVSAIIIYNLDTLFGAVITLTTVYMQPLIGITFAIMLTWVLRQNKLLNALKDGAPDIEKTWFWKIWPWYVKFVCPVLILLVIWQSQ